MICVDSIKITPVDTTGAGDAFYSFVLFSLDGNLDKLTNEEFIKDILFKANVVGAFATLKKGAVDVVPSLSEVNEFVNNH